MNKVMLGISLALAGCASMRANQSAGEGREACISRNAPIPVEMAKAKGWRVELVPSASQYEGQGEEEVTHMMYVITPPDGVICQEEMR